MLSGIILQDVLATLFVPADGAPSPLRIVLGSLIPACAVVGTTAAILIDRRST